MVTLTPQQQVAALVPEFRTRFGHEPTHAVSAPGRVNLIGEHTDYNDGFVMPLAIQRQAVMVAAPRTDGQVCVASTGAEGIATFAASADLKPGEPAWSNYVRGPVALCLQKGMALTGMDILLDSTVPLGAGLSSSAALEVATATLCEALSGTTMDPVDKALLCQQAEHTFPGTPCGIMDMFISAMGRQGHALLIDCRSHETTAVPIDPEQVAVVVANSNKSHDLTDGGYAARRKQCEAAATVLGVKALRDADLAMLDAKREAMDAVAYRRARHVISENQRTVDCAAALQASDWARVGELMFASHLSLSNDFEVSTPELDTLVELASECMDGSSKDSDGSKPRGVIGARMTGGGFGGCTVTLVRADAVDPFVAFLEAGYHVATGVQAEVFVTRPAAGAAVLALS